MLDHLVWVNNSPVRPCSLTARSRHSSLTSYRTTSPQRFLVWPQVYAMLARQPGPLPRWEAIAPKETVVPHPTYRSIAPAMPYREPMMYGFMRGPRPADNMHQFMRPNGPTAFGRAR